jgi:hypothetical protein
MRKVRSADGGTTAVEVRERKKKKISGRPLPGPETLNFT